MAVFTRKQVWWIVAICVILCVLLGIGYARAQVVVERPISEYDWSPVINQAIGVAILILTGVLSWAGIALRSWLASSGVLKDQQTLDVLQSRFDQASLLALAMLESMMRKQTGSQAKSIDWTSIGIDDPLLREAADWLKKHWPEAAGKMTVEDITKSLFARIPSGAMTERAIDFAEAKAAGKAVVIT